MALANDTSYGLGSYVFTTDQEQAARVADRIDVGMVYVNLVLADSPSCRSAATTSASAMAAGRTSSTRS